MWYNLHCSIISPVRYTNSILGMCPHSILQSTNLVFAVLQLGVEVVSGMCCHTLPKCKHQSQSAPSSFLK